MFHILNLDTKELIKNRDGSLRVFEDGEKAQTFCKRVRTNRLQPRKAVATAKVDWRARETAKFVSGHYKLPEFLNKIAVVDHYLHIALDDKKYLAYTKNEEKGLANIKTRISLLGYIEKYHSKMVQSERDDLTRKFLGQIDDGVRFAKTPEEITAVYTKPHENADSCMAATFPGFPCHPTAVYGAGDLAIAYVLTLAGRIKARCLCWPAKKVYGRVYGNDALHNLMRARGYEKSSTYYGKNGVGHNGKLTNTGINGARMLAVRKCPGKDDRLFVVSSIDEGVHFKLNRKGTHFIITEKGFGSSGGAGGYIAYGFVCKKTGKWYRPECKQFMVVTDKLGHLERWSYHAVQKFAVKNERGVYYASKKIMAHHDEKKKTTIKIEWSRNY